MIEYKVVSSSRPDSFEETVSDLLIDGCELQGSPFISQIGARTQALTRTKKASRGSVSK